MSLFTKRKQYGFLSTQTQDIKIFGSTRLFRRVYLHTLFSGFVDIKSIKIDNKFPITLTHGNRDNFGCAKYDQNILIFLLLDLHGIANTRTGHGKAPKFQDIELSNSDIGPQAECIGPQADQL